MTHDVAIEPGRVQQQPLCRPQRSEERSVRHRTRNRTHRAFRQSRCHHPRFEVRIV
jgi:hypothetical protein